MTKVWEVAKSAFFGGIVQNDGQPPELWHSLQADVDELLKQNFGIATARLRRAVGYSFVDVGASDVVVVEDATGAVVGAFSGDPLLVSPPQRRRNIGASLVVVLFERTPWTSPPGKYSKLRLRTLRRAHALEVCAAFLRGEDILNDVRSDYGLPPHS